MSSSSLENSNHSENKASMHVSFEETKIDSIRFHEKDIAGTNSVIFPIDIYNSNIERALSGNARSMFLLSQSFNKCKWPSMPSHEQIEKLKQESIDHGLDFFIEEIDENLRICASLYEVTDGKNIHELRDSWLEAAADEGDVFANLQSLRNYPGDTLASEIEPLLYDALKESQNDVYLREKALREVLHYYSDHIEPSYNKDIDPRIDYSQHPRRGDGDSWSLLHCKSLPGCDFTKAKKDFSDWFSPFDLEVTLSRMATLEDHINSEEWDKLGLTFASSEELITK